MKAASELERAVALVEQTIRGLGIDPATTRTQGNGQIAYALRRGSARILVALHAPTTERPDGRLRVVAPVVRLPAQARQQALMQRLLEANASELSGVAFGISAGEVVAVSERSIRDLDPSEVDATIRNVGRVADRYDDELAQAYGAPRSSDA